MKKILPFIFLFIVWMAFSYQYFLMSKVPFASDYQLNFFPPWNSYQEFHGPVKNNAQPDIITQIYPWRHFAIEEWKAGRLPLWNPYSFAGTPHLANYQSATLFPLNAVFFLPIDFIDGWSVLVLLQPLLAGIFTYLYLRELGVGKYGSLVSSISFMFCGFITTWLGYATLGYAILFLPLALFSVEKYLKTNNSLYGALLSLTIPLSLFSGHFQTSIYFLIIVFSYLLLKVFKKKNSNLKVFLYFLFGILMSLPQVLPSVEFYRESVRSQLFQKVETIPWKYLPTIFAPDYYGNPVTRNDWFGHYAEWSSYVGVVGLSFFIFSLLSKKTKEALFFTGAFLVSFLLAFETPLSTLLVALKLPVLSTSAASRIIVLASFSISVLAGYGYDSLVSKGIRKQKFIYWLVILVVSVIAFFMASFIIPEADKRVIAQKNMILPVITLVTLAVLVFLNRVIRNKKILALIPLAIITVTSFEMVRFASKWQPFEPKGDVFKEVDTTKFYSEYNGYDRFLGDFTAENSVYYRLQSLGGYDPLYPARYGKLVRYIGSGTFGEGERSVVNFPKNGEYVSKAIDFLGVKYIAHKISDGTFPWAFPFNKYPVDKFSIIYDDGHYKIFENKQAYKKAFLVFNTKTLKEDKKILESLVDLDLTKTAIVETDGLKLDNNSKGEVKVVEYKPNVVTLDVNSRGKGLLVLMDNYFPGWMVTVNDVRKNVERVDFNFRGVVVPRGHSIVKFYYLPQSFTFGVYFSLLGLFGVIMLGIYKNFKIKK